MNYRYHLLKYAGIRTRYTCPSCGRKHCFAPYVDADDRPHLAITVSDLVQHNATPSDHAAHIDIADLLIKWRQTGNAAGDAAGTADLTDPTSGSTGDTSDNASGNARTLNPVFLQVQKYISPEHQDNVLALIEELELEVEGVGRMTVPPDDSRKYRKKWK
ncbi:MAG: hypothetical protein Q4B16_09325 [Bacteroidia bacterium]|nr:hypothetical protein [Bacteroidia bacterium]